MRDALGIKGSRPEPRAARRVFEGALIGHLRRRGATTESAMLGYLGWFWLRLNEQEIRELLEAAYRDDLIAPTGRTQRIGGQPIAEQEWKVSTLGRAVTQARSLSMGDARVKLFELAEPAVKDTETWAKRISTVAGGLGAVLLGLSPLFVLLALGVLLAYVVGSGLRDDARLRSAALAWPRLEICRPGIRARYVEEWRPWPPPVDLVVIAYLLALAGLIGVFGTWKLLKQHSLVSNWGFADPFFGLPAALATIVLLVLYGALRWSDWRRYRAIANTFGAEVDNVERLRDVDSQTAHECAWGHQCDATHPPGEPLQAASTSQGFAGARRGPRRPALLVGLGLVSLTGLILGIIFISSGIRGTYSSSSAAAAAAASFAGSLLIAMLCFWIERKRARWDR